MKSINNISEAIQLVSRKEAAEMLAVSTRTLDRILLEEERFTKYYIRGSVRLDRAEIVEYVFSSR